MKALRARERRLLLGHVEEHVDEARHGLDQITRIIEEDTGDDATSNDSGLLMLDQLATTRDASGEAVHTLAIELLRRGARARDVAAAAEIIAYSPET